MKKNEVLINFLKAQIKGYKVKAEYSTNDNDLKVIIVQETDGEKTVFFNSGRKLFNYFQITIFGKQISEQKQTADLLGDLIGQMNYYSTDKEKWQLIFKQVINPQTIEYQDIRRVGYNLTLKIIINKIWEEDKKCMKI